MSAADMTTLPASGSAAEGVIRKRGAGFLPYLLALPSLLVCVGILVPFVTAVFYSLERYNLAFPQARKFIWFGNYIKLFNDADFWNTVTVSMTYTVLTVGVELVLGLGIALLLWRRSWVTNLLNVLLILPLMVAPAIASLMWKLMTNSDFGVLSYLVSVIGFPNFRWATAPGSAMFTVVLVDVWVYTPFIAILLLAGLRGLPSQPFEAAELDGVPQTFVFFHILTATLFRMLDSIQQFDIIYAMTQGGPGNTLMVFQIQAYLQAFTFTNIGRSSAILMVLWAITYALSKYFMSTWTRLRERAHGVA
jgi:multiple sugar transport system permease protein